MHCQRKGEGGSSARSANLVPRERSLDETGQVQGLVPTALCTTDVTGKRSEGPATRVRDLGDMALCQHCDTRIDSRSERTKCAVESRGEQWRPSVRQRARSARAGVAAGRRSDGPGIPRSEWAIGV